MGIGPIPNPQSPIPNPNPQSPNKINQLKNLNLNSKFLANLIKLK